MQLFNSFKSLTKLLSVELLKMISWLQSKNYNEMGCSYLKFPGISEEERYPWSSYMLFETHGGTRKFINYLVNRVYNNSYNTTTRTDRVSRNLIG